MRSNDLGGHVDYSKSGLLGLNFLHYTDAPGINSFYFGGGAAFEIVQFEVIRPIDNRAGITRDSLLGGGLNIDLLVGYEFLRASSVHFFGQLEVERARLPGEDRERLGRRQHLDARRDRPDRRHFLAMAPRGHVGLFAGALLLLVAGPAAAQLRTCVAGRARQDRRRTRWRAWSRASSIATRPTARRSRTARRS